MDLWGDVHVLSSHLPALVSLPPMQTSTNAPWGSISAVAMLDVTTCTGPTSVNVKTDTRVTDGTVCVSKSCPRLSFLQEIGGCLEAIAEEDGGDNSYGRHEFPTC